MTTQLTPGESPVGAAPPEPDFEDARNALARLACFAPGTHNDNPTTCPACNSEEPTILRATLAHAESEIARLTAGLEEIEGLCATLTAQNQQLAEQAGELARLRPLVETAQPRMVDQKGPGDCFTACLASLTGIPLDDFPSPPEVRERATEVAYNNAIQSLLIDRGWMKVTTWRRAPMGYAVATGPSPRDPAISHCVIVRDGKLVHDPHPDKIGIAVAEEFEVLVPLALSPSVPQQETCEQRVPWAGHVEKLPCGHELPCPFHGPIDHD